MTLPVCSMILTSFVFGVIAVYQIIVLVSKTNISQLINKFEIPKLSWEVAKIAPVAAVAIFCIVAAVEKEVVVGGQILVTVKKCGNDLKTAKSCDFCSISNTLAKRN